MSDDQSSERSKDGTFILQHKAREPGWVAPEHADPSLDDHIVKSIGPIEMVFHELVSDNVHVDIHWVKATSERPFHVLVTTGMSARSMTMPRGTPLFAEVLVLLPPAWPIDVESWKDERHYWPVRWLKIAARLPHEHKTWLAPGHTLPNGDPPARFADNTDLCCILFGPSMSMGETLPSAVISDGSEVHFLAMYPLYADEMNFKLERGVEAMIDKFEAAGVTDVVDVGRRSVV